MGPLAYLDEKFRVSYPSSPSLSKWLFNPGPIVSSRHIKGRGSSNEDLFSKFIAFVRNYNSPDAFSSSFLFFFPIPPFKTLQKNLKSHVLIIYIPIFLFCVFNVPCAQFFLCRYFKLPTIDPNFSFMMFHRFAVSFLLVLTLSMSDFALFSVEGRILLSPNDDTSKMLIDGELILRAQIGSRPPRCEGRCSYCAHCEAIQVPTNPQSGRGASKNAAAAAAVSTYGFSGDDYHSNYKPMSWKCKCGNLIFNP